MKQLEKEQVPKVIALGVMAAGLLGYAGYSWLGGGAAAPAVASTPHPAATAAPTADPHATNPVLQLAAIDHADPFRPAIVLSTGKPEANKPPAPPATKPAAKPAATQMAAKPPTPPLADDFNGPAMELPGEAATSRVAEIGAAHPDPTHPGGAAPSTSAPVAHPKPAVAPRPDPPAIVVTGILEGDDNVAILKWNDDHRQVVRAGDRLDGGFVVKAIRPDAVMLARGSFQWTARLGAAKPTGN
jgi:hypothetical protein